MLKHFTRVARLQSISQFQGSSSHEPKPPRTDLLTPEDIQKLRKIITVAPNYEERTAATYSWLPKLKFLYTPAIVKFLATCFSTGKAEGTSDVLIPPKAHENSVFVYQAQQLGNQIRFARSCDWVLGGFLIVGSTYPVFSTIILAFAYTTGMNAYLYELSRRLVTRMDLLPHTQQVSVQRVGAFGRVFNKLHRVEDLEYVDYEKVSQNENYFWGLNYQVVDPQLIFRDRTTGEYLMFDRRGVWNREGIDHELLN